MQKKQSKQKTFNRTAVAVCVSVAVLASAANYSVRDEGYPLTQDQQAYLANKKASKDAHPKRFDKPQEAIDFYVKQRAPLGSDSIDNLKYGAAMSHINQMTRYSIKSDKMMLSKNQMRQSASVVGKGIATDGPTEPGVVQEWSNLGPGNIGGRTRALVIDPNTPDTMYSAGVTGGVWKTIDAGENWLPLNDMMVNLAVTTLALSPTDSNVIYAGTGEGFFNSDAIRGAGLFVSTDAGQTWTQRANTAGNPDFHYLNKLAVSHVTPNRLFAATRQGLFRSDDAGVNWTHLMEVETPTGCLDVKVRTDADELLVSCGSFVASTVYRSADGGDTFAPVIEDPLMGRTTLAFAPSDQNIAYALSATNSADQTVFNMGFYKLHRSEDGGATWTVKNSNENENVVNTLLLSNPIFGLFPECGWGADRSFFNQGWYDNIVQVDPINPDVVWTGGVDLWRSDDAGANFSAASRWWTNPAEDPSYAHADQHALVFHPNYDGQTNTTLYVGNDGGVLRTQNANASTLDIAGMCGAPVENAVAWTDLNNNYAITQFYHGAVMPDGTAYLGGTQDNGTLFGDDESGKQDWMMIAGGDGGWVAIDPRNPDIIFSEFTGLSLQRFDPEQGAWVGATNGIEGGAAFPFITPYIMDVNNPDRLWIGSDRLWRTDDQGDNWVQASAPTLDESIVSEWAVAPGNSERVIAGTNSGMLMISTSASTTDATTQWHTIKPTAGYVSDVAISPSNNRVAYVTYSTFGVNHIWKTIDGGVTFNAIDNMGEANGLPDIPVNSIVIDPSNRARLFVGTDLGIFVSVDAGRNWSADGSGFANTPVAHLEINNGQLYAFTHGRSAYRVDLSTLSAALPVKVSTDEDNAFDFKQRMFNAFSGGTPAFDAVVLHALPSNGKLELNGVEVSELTPILVADIDNLRFVPAADFNGDVTIGWHAQSEDVATSTSNDLTITVNPLNDEPTFTLQAGTASVKAGQNEFVTVATPNVTYVPADEAEQSVTYSVTPSSVSFLNVAFNQQTGELKVAPIAKLTGTVSFNITANDGQPVNNTASQTVNFEVEKKSSGGSMGLFALLALPLVGLRRKLFKAK